MGQVRLDNISVVILEPGFQALTRGRTSPVGRDLQARAIRVATRMRSNVSGRPGPNIRTGALRSSIAFLRFGDTPDGLVADIGAQGHRVTKRGWNYSVLLEFGHGTTPAYPWAARSLEAAR